MKKILLKNIGCSFLLCFLSIAVFADAGQFIQAVQSGDWVTAEKLSSSLGRGDIAQLEGARNSNGQSVLHLLVIKGHEKLINTILNLFSQGLSMGGSKARDFIKVFDNNNNTALHLAAACGNKETYDFLSSFIGLVLGDHPADIKNNSGLTARQLLAMPPQERIKICETALFAELPTLPPVKRAQTQPALTWAQTQPAHTCTQLSLEMRAFQTKGEELLRQAKAEEEAQKMQSIKSSLQFMLTSLIRGHFEEKVNTCLPFKKINEQTLKQIIKPLFIERNQHEFSREKIEQYFEQLWNDAHTQTTISGLINLGR